MVDEELDPDLTRFLAIALPSGPYRTFRCWLQQDESGQRAVAVVGHSQALLRTLLDCDGLALRWHGS